MFVVGINVCYVPIADMSSRPLAGLGALPRKNVPSEMPLVLLFPKFLSVHSASPRSQLSKSSTYSRKDVREGGY